MANLVPRNFSASSSHQTASQSLSFGIRRILHDRSSVTDVSPPQLPLPLMLSHRLHLPITASHGLLDAPLPWRPYFGVACTMATDHVMSAWLPSHPSDLALSLATTGASRGSIVF